MFAGEMQIILTGERSINDFKPPKLEIVYDGYTEIFYYSVLSFILILNIALTGLTFLWVIVIRSTSRQAMSSTAYCKYKYKIILD